MVHAGESGGSGRGLRHRSGAAGRGEGGVGAAAGRRGGGGGSGLPGRGDRDLLGARTRSGVTVRDVRLDEVCRGRRPFGRSAHRSLPQCTWSSYRSRRGPVGGRTALRPVSAQGSARKVCRS
ncbi:hypothetical protein STXM2123_193 [Streptomyces sp. F-3]|nr:hypothetical protein STXM2123_193 [Streptomyces sp. F-3]